MFSARRWMVIESAQIQMENLPQGRVWVGMGFRLDARSERSSHAHSVNPSISYRRCQLSRARTRSASAFSTGHSVAGLGMLRDQRISIVA